MSNRRRQAFEIRFRCVLTGCDWTARYWLRDEADAFDVMYNMLRYRHEGSSEGEYRYGREFYRVVECAFSPDQTTRGTP
jgi:hypothetical protein